MAWLEHRLICGAYRTLPIRTRNPSCFTPHCASSLTLFPPVTQLCINFTNESLHNLFIEHVFKLEQEVYVREEVEWNFVNYEDNQHVIDLIAKRPGALNSVSLSAHPSRASFTSLHRPPAAS